MIAVDGVVEVVVGGGFEEVFDSASITSLSRRRGILWLWCKHQFRSRHHVQVILIASPPTYSIRIPTRDRLQGLCAILRGIRIELYTGALSNLMGRASVARVDLATTVIDNP